MTYEESFDEVIKAMENLNKNIANRTDEFNIMIFNRLPARKKKKIVKWMNKERKKYVKANIKAKTKICKGKRFRKWRNNRGDK